ncbi:MAG TPA: ribose 5-phosphate isomerase A [Puia sp.]|nr:ribose 5-phosphate isomerase A [Puia sp.]
MQDYKKDAAKEALKFVKPGMTVGLGAGSTMGHIVKFIKEDVSLFGSLTMVTSSFVTRQLMLSEGFRVVEAGWLSSLDLYFDGCDQFDWRLSALKSGGGVHVSEKVLAAMAAEFVLVGDSSKKVDRLDAKYPLVVEVLPEALGYVSFCMKKFFNPSRSELRMAGPVKDGAVVTERGNYLIDNWFATFPEPAMLNDRVKSIAGILEHSLFFNMAHRAVIAGPQGIEICSKP